MKIVVAMSGGVDSSVAAYLLKKQGHTVIGLSFELWDSRGLQPSNICCSVETIELAKTVAREIGIEHHTVDVRDAFYRNVIEEFCDSYIQGVTPNPCILCNKYIKFDFLLKQAEALGADRVATGHYARIEQTSSQNNENQAAAHHQFFLKKGLDPKKDQSYVLYVMKREELKQTLFPIGDMNKEDTRRIAKEIGLANALRAESQEICFVGDDSYANFLEKSAPEALQPGPVIDTSGKVLGRHRGVAFYTVGQRKGLGIASLTPKYVVNIDRKASTITVGTREEAMKSAFTVRDLNWLALGGLSSPLEVSVKIRSTMREAPATIEPAGGNTVRVTFDTPQWAPAPGQSAVFYQADIVLGGGIIE